MLTRSDVASLTSDAAWLAAMVEVESALASASASLGLIPIAHAALIERACRTMTIDVSVIDEESGRTGTPIVPLIEQIRAAVGPDVAGSVHRGATSQDVVDTATMLITRGALLAIIADLRAASDATAELARAHRTTPITGRTLLQRAVPTTFGLKAAGWMRGLDRAIQNLSDVRLRALAVQLGGAAGTLAAFEGRGRDIAADLASRLGLDAPAIPWHTERTRIGEVACALGVAAGATMKPARDVVLLAQSEVGEVAEGLAGRGRSSTLPQKRNPIAAVTVIANAQHAPGLVANLLAAMAQEHERAAGNWQAEWVSLRQLLVSTGSAAAWLRDCLEHLEVRPDVMERNLAADGGSMLTERLVAELSRTMPPPMALSVVQEALDNEVAGEPLLSALIRVDHGRSGLDRAAYHALLDPSGYLGDAPFLVDDALRRHEQERTS